MTGWRRYIYELMDWEYYDHPCDRQRHLKYMCVKQIKDTDIKNFLKRKNNIVKEIPKDETKDVIKEELNNKIPVAKKDNVSDFYKYGFEMLY